MPSEKFMANLPPCLLPQEKNLLAYFLEHPDTVLSREKILEDVWPPDSEIQLNTINTVVLRLRRKIKATPYRILTVFKEGYVLVPCGDGKSPHLPPLGS